MHIMHIMHGIIQGVPRATGTIFVTPSLVARHKAMDVQVQGIWMTLVPGWPCAVSSACDFLLLYLQVIPQWHAGGACPARP
jgi:hypothetical protein